MVVQPYRVGAQAIHATVTKPRESLNLLGPAKSLIHVSKRYPVKAGEVLFDKNEPLFLLADHHRNGLYHIFAGLSINCQIEVVQTEATVNPVTKMKDERRQVGPSRKVWACQDALIPGQVVGLTSTEVVYYLGVPVTTQHLINGQRVRNVVKLNGVYLAEVA